MVDNSIMSCVNNFNDIIYSIYYNVQALSNFAETPSKSEAGIG